MFGSGLKDPRLKSNVLNDCRSTGRSLVSNVDVAIAEAYIGEGLAAIVPLNHAAPVIPLPSTGVCCLRDADTCR